MLNYAKFDKGLEHEPLHFKIENSSQGTIWGFVLHKKKYNTVKPHVKGNVSKVPRPMEKPTGIYMLEAKLTILKKIFFSSFIDYSLKLDTSSITS